MLQPFNRQLHERVSSFLVRHHSLFTLCVPDVTHMIRSPSPSPSVFACCNLSKTAGGLGRFAYRLVIIFKGAPSAALSRHYSCDSLKVPDLWSFIPVGLVHNEVKSLPTVSAGIEGRDLCPLQCDLVHVEPLSPW